MYKGVLKIKYITLCALLLVSSISSLSACSVLDSDNGSGTVSESAIEMTSAEDTTDESIAITTEAIEVSTETESVTTEENVASASNSDKENETGSTQTFNVQEIPEYSGSPVYIVNDNVPFFTDDDKINEAFETYSSLDNLGRCGVAFANICRELMPTEERGEIGEIKPTGWHTVKYPEIIEDIYLYNRCHLIAYQLAGENANEKNLITGTRYMNVSGMIPYENKVYDYVDSTDNHVLYRVTPVFEEDNLLASGVLMEGLSVEDDGKGVCFCVYAYNVQPGIIIDYATGESEADPDYHPIIDLSQSTTEVSVDDGTYRDLNKEESTGGVSDSTEAAEYDYVLNTNTRKFHYPTCKSVSDMKDKNKGFYTGDRETLIEQGYSPCGRCKP